MRQRLLHLQCGDLHLTLAPEIGGSIAEFFQIQRGQRRDILRPATAAALTGNDAREMASFPLLPFCNRIRDSTFSFDGKIIRLTPNLPPSVHAIHGIGWQLPWQVIAHTADRIVLALDYGRTALQQQFGWPWAFYAEQEFQLRDCGLYLTTRLQNRSHRPMPCGLGHHPYFQKTDKIRLQTSLHGMWVTDVDVLPYRLQQPEFLSKMSQGIGVENLQLDHNFIGWNGTVRMTEVGEAHAIRLSADAGLDFLGLYVPAGAAYFCVEPVSMCTDAFNLKSRFAIEYCGGQILQPGESLEMGFSIELEVENSLH